MANRFESELSASFKQLHWWYHKLSVTVGRSARFTGKVPFDYLATTSNFPMGMEAKSTKELGSFPFNRLAEHQIYGLLEFKSHGWPAYILINFRKPANIAYAVEIDDWLAYIGSLDRKSVPKDAFEKESVFVPVPRVKVDGKLTWDLREVEKHALSKGRKQWQKSIDSNPAQTTLPSRPSKPRTKRKPKAG